MISFSASILHRLNQFSNPAYEAWMDYTKYKISRDRAHWFRKKIVRERGSRTVDNKLIKEIKRYCREFFDSSSYWPWLAVYTELRGEFVPGWVPYDYYRFNLLPRVNPIKFMRLSEAKTLDHQIFKGAVISPQFIRLNGKYYDEFGEFKTEVEIEEMLSEMDCEVVIKPDNGKGGEGVIFKEASEINLREIPIRHDFIVQPVIEQHSELKSLNPNSVNTFRVFTCIGFAGEVVVKFIILRFGRSDSRVDNATGGGGWIIIHSDGIYGPMAYDVEAQLLGRSHPDTAMVYSELNFPFIEKISEFCIELHKSFPYNGVVGWDIAVNEMGEPLLLEWNANNPFFWQIEAYYGPFFKQEVVENHFVIYN